MILKSVFHSTCYALALLALPVGLTSCSFAWSDPNAAQNEKVREFGLGGHEETSAERDARSSREAISVNNRHMDNSITRPLYVSP
jgi:dihydroxyacetone kinase